MTQVILCHFSEKKNERTSYIFHLAWFLPIMCTSPIKISNNSVAVDYRHFKKLYRYVPCGHCAQCLQKKGLDYATRSYFEAFSCFQQNGFILFDTLTYDDKHLKTWSDVAPELWFSYFNNFSTFYYKDVQLFLKDLRIRLERKGYDVADRLRFILTSEYGADGVLYVDDRGRKRKSTFRPHYHILFFSTVEGLSPETLSVEISSTWNCGRTDGLVYNPFEFKDKVFREFSPHAYNKIQYVQKYITKIAPWDRKVLSRLKAAMYKICGANWMDYPEFRERYSQLKRKLLGFVKNSLGFGFGVRWTPESESQIRSMINKHTLPDYRLKLPAIHKTKGVEIRTLPTYIRNKLFRKSVKTFGGFRTAYNNKSFDYVKRMYRSEIQRYMNDAIKAKDYFTMFGVEKYADIYKNRLQQYAEYRLVYQYALGVPSGDPLKDYLLSVYSDDGFNSNSHHTLFFHSSKKVGYPAYSFKYLGRQKREKFINIDLDNKALVSQVCEQKRDKFPIEVLPLNNLCCINQCYKGFHDFDTFAMDVDYIISMINNQKAFDLECDAASREYFRTLSCDS